MDYEVSQKLNDTYKIQLKPLILQRDEIILLFASKGFKIKPASLFRFAKALYLCKTP